MLLMGAKMVAASYPDYIKEPIVDTVEEFAKQVEYLSVIIMMIIY